MKLGVVITMYDEHRLVVSSVTNIREHFPEAKIVVIQSDDGLDSEELDKIAELSDIFLKLPDLAPRYDFMALPAQVICRNIARGCRELYQLGAEFDCIAILTGDTLIQDAQNFQRRYQDMLKKDWLGIVSQAVGQRFHSDIDDPPNGIVGGRPQPPHTTDFLCQLFFLRGSQAVEKRAFANIPVTNKWCSEQCLGDEMIRFIDGDGFHAKIGRLNAQKPTHAYSYGDGVFYHARTGGRPGR